MNAKAFKFNSEAKYNPGLQKAAARDVGNLAEGQVQVQADDLQKWFRAKYRNVFEHYRLPRIYSDDTFQAWCKPPMQFWQNQLNFAVWCATTGCGVSADDHLTVADAPLQSFYRFHAYYQTRRILEDIQARIPPEQEWKAVNNPYDREGYERICEEFGISPHSDWKIRGHTQGLGRVYFYLPGVGYSPVGDGEYNPDRMSFTHETEHGIPYVDYIDQDTAGVDTAWKNFILNKSDGFTLPGVNRLKDSSRTYVWAILTAQAQTRANILGVGATASDTQQQFLAIVETVIASPVDIPGSIARYQEALQYARSEVNLSFGEGIYIAPGNMLLRVGKIVGYNNLLVIATSAQLLGSNIGLNKIVAPPDAANDTGEKGLVMSMGVDPPSEATNSQRGAKPHPASAATATAAAKADHEAHEDEKTALIVGSIIIGLGLLWFLG